MTKNNLIRGISIFVTLCLLCGVYLSHQKYSAADVALREIQLKHQKVQREHQRWADLKEDHARLSKEVEVTTKNVSEAFASFWQEELRDARDKVMSEAKLDKAVVVAHGSSGFVWVPEAGHKISFFFEVEDLPEGEDLKLKPELPRRLDFELTPNELHSFEFVTFHPEYKTLRFEFDSEVRFEIALPVPFDASTTPSLRQMKIYQPSVLGSDGLYRWPQGSFSDHLRNGAWHLCGPISCNCDSGQITCRAVLFGPGSSYTQPRGASDLKSRKIATTEVVDPQSPWYGLFRIEPEPMQ